MKTSRNQLWIAIVVATVLGMFTFTACNKNAQHADVKDAVSSAIAQAGLNDVKVSQDRDKGVLTLSGDVNSADDKSRAESVAKSAAADYTIANEIGVRPQGAESQAKAVDSNLDDGIENNFKAAIKAHKNLDDQSIHADAKNGTLELTGSVKTAAQKAEVGKLAKSIPNVKEVVNTIEVKAGKHTTAAN